MLTELTILIHGADRKETDDIMDKIMSFVYDLVEETDIDISAVSETSGG